MQTGKEEEVKQNKWEIKSMGNYLNRQYKIIQIVHQPENNKNL